MDTPYFINPDIAALKTASGEDRTRLRRKIATAIGNPIALRAILGVDSDEFSEFYPDMTKPDLSTEDTIDSFLDKYGDPDAKNSTEVKNVEELVPVDPGDFDLNLIEDESQEDTPDDDTASLLDSFLANNPPKKPSAKKKENPVLSESLAKAMIKNGNYQKALEIITDLNLNNPKKSIYFADQIRFLKKLILNQSKSTTH